MISFYIALLVVLIVLLFGLGFKNLDKYIALNHSKKGSKTVMKVITENMFFSDMIEGIHGVVFDYQIKTFDQSQQDILQGKVDFGLFHKLSVKQLPKGLHKEPIRKQTDTDKFLDDDLMDQNVVLVTSKKNIQKLKEFGIIKK